MGQGGKSKGKRERERERQLNLILLSTAKIHCLIVNTQDLGGG